MSPMPTDFVREGSELVCEGVRLTAVARAVGTPVYVYSAGGIRDAYTALDRAFASRDHRLHYALKANSTLAVARLLRELGAGVNANSGGEIEVAMRAGYTPSDIVLTGVGKTQDELQRAVALGVTAINVESPGELERIEQVARTLATRARVALRINPDIDARSHPHISTGSRTDKFGIPVELARPLYREIRARSLLVPVGVHVHVGSQIVVVEPLARAAAFVAGLVRDLLAEGIPIEHANLGGGLGISYDGTPVASVSDYASAVLPALRDIEVRLLLEPGRVVVARAGVLLSRVVDIKEYPSGPRFVVLDSGMTELLRPALYGAFHRVEPVTVRAGTGGLCQIAGPLCESSDLLGTERQMPPLEVGDLLAIRDAGAYGFVMASTYNRRTLPPEVLVDGDRWRVIRRRQTLADLLALEE
jgi:diaminopimelate decarboxylase